MDVFKRNVRNLWTKEDFIMYLLYLRSSQYQAPKCFIHLVFAIDIGPSYDRHALSLRKPPFSA